MKILLTVSLKIITLVCACTLFIISTAFAGQVNIVSQTVLQNKMMNNEPMIIIDVRTSEEYAQGHVPNAINISHDQIEQRFSEISAFKDKELVIYCRSGRRAGIVEAFLLKKGFSNINHLDGDYNAWHQNSLPFEADLPVEK